jgi:predicted GIY-YIG superfamily endonuclease
VPIDGCPHSFQELADEILPADMARMREAMRAPVRMRSFCEGGVKTIAKRIGKPGDFQGCYLLLEKGEPFYVGISRRIIARLIQHVKGRTHFDASLAYRMACACRAIPEGQAKLRREEAMANETFIALFRQEQERIRGMDVATIEVPNDLELYLFEAYCALELRTVAHNTFRTH